MQRKKIGYQISINLKNLKFAFSSKIIKEQLLFEKATDERNFQLMQKYRADATHRVNFNFLLGGVFSQARIEQKTDCLIDLLNAGKAYKHNIKLCEDENRWWI